MMDHIKVRNMHCTLSRGKAKRCSCVMDKLEQLSQNTFITISLSIMTEWNAEPVNGSWSAQGSERYEKIAIKQFHEQTTRITTWSNWNLNLHSLLKLLHVIIILLVWMNMLQKFDYARFISCVPSSYTCSTAKISIKSFKKKKWISSSILFTTAQSNHIDWTILWKVKRIPTQI